MLLRFGVTNHLSLRDRQELSLVASSLDDEASGLIACPHPPGGRLLPAVVIYGANASGKSNLIDAIWWTRRMVLYSHRAGLPHRPIARRPFALDSACQAAPTKIEVDLVVENVRYHYGFEATDGAFTAEWLYSFPRERRQMLFERDNATFVFGRHLKGRNQVISELTRPNSLFLSAAAQNGHDELTRIFLFFQAIQLDTGAPSQPAALAVKLRRKEADERIIRYLEMSGTGITGYRVDEASLDRLLS